jgi:hypothetical protein
LIRSRCAYHACTEVPEPVRVVARVLMRGLAIALWFLCERTIPRGRAHLVPRASEECRCSPRARVEERSDAARCGTASDRGGGALIRSAPLQIEEGGLPHQKRTVILRGMATQLPPDPRFLEGVRAGVERARRTNLEFPFDRFRAVPESDLDLVDERFASPLETAQQSLQGAEASGRFTELFAEMLTVAVIAREAYGDPALTEPEITSYLQHSFSIFNSFRHA